MERSSLKKKIRAPTGWMRCSTNWSHQYHGGHGFESRWRTDFLFLAFLSNRLNRKINCDDHSSLSSTTAVQISIISSILLKLINNSSSQNTQNRNCEGSLDTLSYLEQIFLQFYFSVYSLVFVLIEKIYQTLETVFHPLSKHLQFRQKYCALRRTFNSLLCVWMSQWNTVSHVWYITSHPYRT